VRAVARGAAVASFVLCESASGKGRAVAQDWNNFATVVGSASGALTGLAGDDGLYWVAASGVLSLVGGVLNAWLFLTRS
jgi:hypothetical protein